MLAPLPVRNFARLLLLGGATLALIGALHQIRTPPMSATAPEAAVAIRKAGMDPG